MLPFGLGDSPATCPAGLLGMLYIDFSNGNHYRLCKNTSAAALDPGVGVTLETPASYYVDLVVSDEPVFGVVNAAKYTGSTIAVNDYFWVLEKGMGYVSKGLATGSAAIAAAAWLESRSLGCFAQVGAVTSGGKSITALIRGGRLIHACSSVASSATTRVLAYLT
jgi:hypothetical protein